MTAPAPAADVRVAKHVIREEKTPVLTGPDTRALFTSIPDDTRSGIRDRALLGVMVYTFARISAVCALDIEDYYQVGRIMVRLREKGGRHHEMPAHHTAVEYLDAYLDTLGATKGPL